MRSLCLLLLACGPSSQPPAPNDVSTEAAANEMGQALAPTVRPSPPAEVPEVQLVPAQMQLHTGARVLIAGHGVGRVENVEWTDVQGVSTEVVTFSTSEQAVAVPKASAHEVARPLISNRQARSALTTLRTPCPAVPATDLASRTSNYTLAIAQDSSAQMTKLLCALYGEPGPLTDSDKLLVLIVERDVLGEIGEVLHQDPHALHLEMRDRYHPSAP